PDAEVDFLIYQLRKAFPLVAKRITEALDSSAEDAPIEAMEARNVCDGLRLLDHLRSSEVKTYPWGKPLERGRPAEEEILSQEVQALSEIHDAIADLAIAESVHQMTEGNPDRAAAVMDAFSKGGFPSQPDVVRTPRSGVSLTHRLALHLPATSTA